MITESTMDAHLMFLNLWFSFILHPVSLIPVLITSILNLPQFSVQIHCSKKDTSLGYFTIFMILLYPINQPKNSVIFTSQCLVIFWDRSTTTTFTAALLKMQVLSRPALPETDNNKLHMKYRFIFLTPLDSLTITDKCVKFQAVKRCSSKTSPVLRLYSIS
jgi:hypothetical protein